MRKFLRVACGLMTAAVLTTTVGATGTAAAGEAQDRVVSTASSARTPQILDASRTVTEKVLDMAQVGNRIVVAGIFTKVRDVSVNGGTTFSRSNVFAFDPATGAVDRTFVAAVNGPVNTVLAGPDGRTVYLGGSFTILNGKATRNLVEVSLANGQQTGFRAPATNGAVSDLLLIGGRLHVGGQFTTMGSVGHRGLATLDPVTGALDPYMGVDVSGNHNYPHNGKARSAVGVENFAVSPDGTRLAVIGNFRVADSLPRDQAMVVLLNPGAAAVDPAWRTRRFEAPCSADRWDSYMRSIDFAPDGSFFAVTATGAPHAGTLCDTVSAWANPAVGQDLQPKWVGYTGGDTLFSVAVTGSAVYVGGHQRWMNNPNGNDSAGPGAVPRPGLAALDPRTGVPLSWNPGRSPRGVGAEALLATADGLYVGSDTDYIGNRQYLRPRLAYFPLAGAPALPSEDTGTLPGNVFLAGRSTPAGGAAVGDVRSRWFTGATAEPDEVVPTGGVDWSKARGGVLIGGTLFYGYPNSAGTYYLYRRTFDGEKYGPATAIDPYNDRYWSTISAGQFSGRTVYYRGKVPTLYGAALSKVTGMFYRDGRLYYSRSGLPTLFYRSFSPDSGILGPEMSAGGTGFDVNLGMFASGNTIYAAYSGSVTAGKPGELRRITFVNGAPSGAWQPASPGPADGGRDWRTRVMFLGPGGPNQLPVADFTSSCYGLVCTFDAGGSSDPDGTVTGYAWAFGDGTTGSGRTVTHQFPSDEAREVTLTVTDNRSGTGQRTQPVTLTVPEAGIALRGAAGTSASGVTSVSVTVPADVAPGDAMLLVLSTSSAVTGTPPAGWALEGTRVSGTNITTQVWSRTAEAGDAGSALPVALSASAKVTLQLAAYSGVSTTDPVGAVAGRDDVGGTSHTTPTADATAGSWVVSIWSDKQTAARTWTPPTAWFTARSNLPGKGSGDMATLLGDSGMGLPAGTVGGLTATVPTVSNRATVFTVVLNPAG